MGFKVIKDIINAGEDVTLTGREYNDYKGGKQRIRLLDDDGNIYFYLFYDDELNGYEDEAFSAVDYFMNSYGTTELQYKDEKTGEYRTL